MIKFILEEVNSFGFVRFKDIIDYMKMWIKNKAIDRAEETGESQKIVNSKSELYVKQMIESALKGYGFKIVRFNKEYKTKFNMIESKEQSRIIVREE